MFAGDIIAFCMCVYLRERINRCVWVHLCVCACVCAGVCARACVTHSSVVSLGMPLGRECSPLLLHRTTPSKHVQTSGQPDAGRQPLSSAPWERWKREKKRGMLRRDKETKERDIKRTNKSKNGHRWEREKSNSEKKKVGGSETGGREEKGRKIGIHRDKDWTVIEARGQSHTAVHSAVFKEYFTIHIKWPGAAKNQVHWCVSTSGSGPAGRSHWYLKTLWWIWRNTEQMLTGWAATTF